MRSVGKRSERHRRLEASERRSRAVFQRANDAIFIANGGGELVNVDPAAVDLFGVEREPLVGRTIDEYDFDRPPDSMSKPSVSDSNLRVPLGAKRERDRVHRGERWVAYIESEPLETWGPSRTRSSTINLWRPTRPDLSVPPATRAGRGGGDRRRQRRFARRFEGGAGSVRSPPYR